jgi:hypothetical protein
MRNKKSVRIVDGGLNEEFDRNRLLNEFRREVGADASRALLERMSDMQVPGGPAANLKHEEMLILLEKGTDRETGFLRTLALEVPEAARLLSGFIPAEKEGGDEADRLWRLYRFMITCKDFNIDSPDQVRYWLFRVKGLLPLRASGKGGLKLAWEQVPMDERDLWDLGATEFRPRSRYRPSADHQTIEFYSSDPAVSKLQKLRMLFHG